MGAKYKSKLFAPLKLLSCEAAALVMKNGVRFEDFVVTPIPLSLQRSRERGFNQASIISKTISRELSLPHEESILIRNKETVAQHKKNRQDRFSNIENAFLVKRNISGMNILLVDDICTTGATLLEAAKTLHKAGAQTIACFTLAKEF